VRCFSPGPGYEHRVKRLSGSATADNAFTSTAAWLHDFKTCRNSRFPLLLVVSHEAPDAEIFHRGKVEAFERATVGVPGMTMLAESGLEDAAWEGAELVRSLVS
jgi:hypothetical protein